MAPSGFSAVRQRTVSPPRIQAFVSVKPPLVSVLELRVPGFRSEMGGRTLPLAVTQSPPEMLTYAVSLEVCALDHKNQLKRRGHQQSRPLQKILEFTAIAPVQVLCKWYSDKSPYHCNLIINKNVLYHAYLICSNIFHLMFDALYIPINIKIV